MIIVKFYQNTQGQCVVRLSDYNSAEWKGFFERNLQGKYKGRAFEDEGIMEWLQAIDDKTGLPDHIIQRPNTKERDLVFANLQNANMFFDELFGEAANEIKRQNLEGQTPVPGAVATPAQQRRPSFRERLQGGLFGAAQAAVPQAQPPAAAPPAAPHPRAAAAPAPAAPSRAAAAPQYAAPAAPQYARQPMAQPASGGAQGKFRCEFKIKGNHKFYDFKIEDKSRIESFLSGKVDFVADTNAKPGIVRITTNDPEYIIRRHFNDFIFLAPGTLEREYQPEQAAQGYAAPAAAAAPRAAAAQYAAPAAPARPAAPPQYAAPVAPARPAAPPQYAAPAAPARPAEPPQAAMANPEDVVRVKCPCEFNKKIINDQIVNFYDFSILDEEKVKKYLEHYQIGYEEIDPGARSRGLFRVRLTNQDEGLLFDNTKYSNSFEWLATGTIAQQYIEKMEQDRRNREVVERFGLNPPQGFELNPKPDRMGRPQFQQPTPPAPAVHPGVPVVPQVVPGANPAGGNPYSTVVPPDFSGRNNPRRGGPGT